MNRFKTYFSLGFTGLVVLACNNNGDLADAYGNFEADEITISAKVPGELLQFTIVEGQTLKAGDVVELGIDQLGSSTQKVVPAV